MRNENAPRPGPSNAPDCEEDCEEDGESATNIPTPLLKEGKEAKCMSKLIDLFKQSKALDASSFKEWVLRDGGDTGKFVFNNYITYGIKAFQEAIEVCRDMVNGESLVRTLTEHGPCQSTRVPLSLEVKTIHLQVVQGTGYRRVEVDRGSTGYYGYEQV